jgi:hypothetical protein
LLFWFAPEVLSHGCACDCAAGPLPAAWSSLAHLHTLYVNDNHLQGEIPFSWTQMEAMEDLNLSNNAKLSGSFPSNKLQTAATYTGTGLKGGGALF